MKSKIQKNQILTKGVTIFILVVMIVSCLSVTMVSLAAEGDEEETIITDEYLEYDEYTKYESLDANIEEIITQLKKLDEQIETKYANFSKYVKDNASINISSEVELRMLSIYVNQENDCAGKKINITKNIQLTNSIEWEPIGNSSNKFKGTLDGLGHTISGINISIKRSYAGLVGYLGQGGIVKNIRVANSSISIPPELNNEINDLKTTIRVGYEALGAVVGCAEGATITNCVNETEVIGGNAVGGIVGKVITNNNSSVSKVEYCRNEGTIKGFQGVGGIVGDLEGYYSSNDLEKQSQVLNCYNKGTVFGISIDIGGIVGNLYGNTRIENCSNEGYISAPDAKLTYMILGKDTTIIPQNVGGIVGAMACNLNNGTAIVTKSINEGSVFGCSDIGGIAGQVGTSVGGNACVKYCINYSTDVSASERYEKFMGGIAGRIGAIYNNKNYYGGSVQDCICAIKTSEEEPSESTVYPIYKNKTDEENINVRDAIIIPYHYVYRGYDNNTNSYYSYITGYVYNKNQTNSLINNIEVTLHSPLLIHNNNSIYATTSFNEDTREYNFGYWEDMTLKSTNENIENNLTLNDNQYVIDNTKPTISSIDVIASTGTSMASKGDTLLFEVKFNEKVNYTRINPSISFNIGTVSCTANLMKIEDFATGSKATYTYTIESTNSGRISDILVNDSYIWDIFENKIDSNINTAKITNNILIVSKTDDSVTYTKSNESGEDQWTVTYTITGGQYRNGRRYFIGTNEDNAITINAIIDKQISIANGSSGNPTIKLKIGDTYVDVDEYTEVSGSRYQTNDTAFSTKIECKYYSTETSPEGELKDIYIEDNRNINLSYNSTSQVPSLTDGFTQSNTSPENVEGVYRDTTAPSLKLAMSPNTYYGEGDKIIIKATSSEELDGTITIENAPILTLSFGDSDAAKGAVKCTGIQKDESDNTVIIYEYQVVDGDNGKIKVNFIENSEIADLAGNIGYLYKENGYSINEYVDTTAPTLDITAKKVVDTTTKIDISKNVTNADTLEYTFTWSEEVIGFEPKDITVINGTTGDLSAPSSNPDGTYSYTMNIKPNVAPGNEGQVQVIVEANVCKDLVNLTNTRTENIIRVDKKAPRLISLEAYAASDIALDKDIDIVKENYRIGEKITIVATFDENIVSLEENVTGLPELALQFSKSGNAKETVSGRLEGNKIIYTYQITSRDEGTLSVKGFTGTVVDAAGNETRVTKRALEGDTIIADTKAPTLVGITAIAPNFEYDELLQDEDTKRYGVENTITIIAEYSENVYNFSSNTIDKIIDKTIAPTLTLKFSESGNAKGEVAFDKVEGSKIYYKYNLSSEDNGDLSIVSLIGTVSDIAGNTYTTDTQTKLEKVEYYEKNIAEENRVNNIKADTTAPTFTITATAVNYDDNKNVITGNGNDYRKGTVITIIASTNEYVYKNNNKELTRFAENGSDAPQLNISFSTSGDAKGKTECTNVEYKADKGENKTIFTYTYTIEENDNGTLNLNIVELKGYDIALNGNDAKTEQIITIVSDTVRPYYADQPGIEYVNSVYKVAFNEELYYLNENNVVTSFGDIKQAPLLKFEGQETEYEPSISENVITYEGNYINAKPYLGASRLCDKAGNLYSYYDQKAPELLNNSLIVTSPESGTYKAGQEITIVATFSEKIQGEAPKLMIVFGDGETREINTGDIKDNTIEYMYKVQNGDNGQLALVDYDGTELTDLVNNKWEKSETPNLTGNIIIADTKAPTLTITSDVERTNKEIVAYTFTWSESVTGFTAEDIEVTNGSKGAFKATDEDQNGYATKYTLEVDTTNEGRQIVKVNSGICEDIAGNLNVERVTYNKVVIDYTKPVIRAKVNGGDYVLDNTDPENKKSILKETIVVDEELSSMQYVWSSSETIPEDGWVSEDVSKILVNSDINLTKEIKETGTYYLYIKAKDTAGNTTEARTKAFVVKTSKITLTPDKTETTNQDIIVTVAYGEGLTENRKAGVSGLTQSADASKVIVAKNGTVYAEATDKAGNKVYATKEITNIDKTPIEPETPPAEEDKTAPTITFNYTSTVATVNTAIGATITTDEDAIISYSWDNKTWISSEDYVRSQKVVKTPTTAGSYTLYAKAIDKSSNESTVQSLQFTVVRSEEEIKNPEIIFEGLPIVQVNGVKYVKISTGMTTEVLTNKMNKEALLGKTPEYTKLTEDKKLRTGAEITIDGETKYVIVMNGDVNGDGKIDFLGDIILANDYRIGIGTLSTIQKLAADINNDQKVDFISDILAINDYRIGITGSL